MQNSKFELINEYSGIVKLAKNSSPEFAEKLSDFIASELEYQAVIFFKINEENQLVTLGRSQNSKKSYLKNSTFNCTVCKLLKNLPAKVSFSTDADCELQTTDFVIYEGCLLIPTENVNYFLKVAKKTPFTQTDRENLEKLGESIKNLFSIWSGEAGSSNENLGEIITEISHELRSPTNSIMGFASLLNEDNLTPSQSEYVSSLKENAFNLLSLINDLIDLAKFDSGKVTETTSIINIKNFIDEILKIFTEKNDKNKIEFSVNIDKSVPASVKIDSPKTRYVLINILTFSLRQIEKGKIILNITQGSKGQLQFKVSDTSPGISSNKLKEIYKPFSFSEIGNQKIGSSTGLGILIAKKYIEILGGSLDITSSLGKGTTYTFNINAEMMSAIESQILSLPKDSKRNKVLVVEDDYATSKLLSNYLNKWGYEPIIVNSMEQALKSIDKEVFLAILMDIVLPDGNGLELLKKMREHKNSKNTPIIVCSVEAEQQKAFLMGAVEYFVKPIKYKFLVEVLTSYKLKKDSKILCVDDDVPTLNLIKEAIIQAGYNAVAESNPSKVMELIKDVDLDLAIIDLDMPEVNGYELIKQIKSQEKFSKLPIIIYTGNEDYKKDLQQIDGMFADLLHKSSTSIEDLASAINEMINKYDEPPTPEEIVKQNDSVKILLVEDYKHSQIIVTRLLKKNNFDSIVVVENGAEAVEQVKKQHFGLILMDMQMPVMNGFEATAKIRQIPEYINTPIIALTAFAMKGDREKCLDAGATDYIPKPIDSTEFIEKVKHYTS